MSFEYLSNNRVPTDDGFYMPSEYSEHSATIMIWPQREGSWPYKAKNATKVFRNIISEIAKFEKVLLIVSAEKFEQAKSMTSDIENIELLKIENNDAWARDTAPTFVVNKSGKVACIDWKFNAWGGEFDGLYADYKDDDAIPLALAKKLDMRCYNAHPFVLEGGSIHSNGEGTVLVTKECLLSKGRNPLMSQDEIEKTLKKYLGCKKVIWLDKGIYNDETNGHVDNICAFVSPTEVMLAWTDDENDVQYDISNECLKVLTESTDNFGRSFTVHKLPIPKVPIRVEENDLKGYVFEDGEDTREVGERLAGSYVNFYFCNNAVIVPQFGGENKSSDELAISILKRVCKDRQIIPINAKDIILGGGNIHCITQQIPKGAQL